MIQRAQTLHLGICIILMAIFLMSRLFDATMNQTYTSLDSVPGVAVVVTYILLAFFAIFLFKNRPLQAKIVSVALLCNVLAIAAYGYFYFKLHANGPVAIRPGAMILVATLLFTYMALRGIQKDEKLVRQSDRLR